MKRLVLSILVLSFMLSSCAPSSGFDARLNQTAAPYRFSIAGWEWQTLAGQVGQWVFGKPVKRVDDEIKLVTAYFHEEDNVRRLEAEIEAAPRDGSRKTGRIVTDLEARREWQRKQAPLIEAIIRKQIQAVIDKEGIFNPFIDRRISFPPLYFRLQEMPALLVISPRDRIETLREIVLVQDMTLQEKEALEAQVDALGVSSLVVALGGIATYPSLIDNESGLSFAIETIAHEWLHQYLAFTPLGFRYVLDEIGISRNYDISTMNESLSGMFGEEIGAAVYREYYAGSENRTDKAERESGFDMTMREIRKKVDVYLARGEIDGAEEYMEKQRQELTAKGYRIRKLNQAYFAFHGAYGDTPAFENQIGLDLKKLRAKSASLKEFLKTVSRMTSRQELAENAK